MKKIFKAVICVSVSIIFILSLASCGKKASNSTTSTNKGETVDGIKTWYLGGNNLLTKNKDPREIFRDIEDTVDPEKIYSSAEYTAQMLQGGYTLNNPDLDIKALRNELSYTELKFSNGNFKVLSLPVAVLLGKDNICSGFTAYKYSEYENITDRDVALLQLATEDDTGFFPCVYEVSDNKIIFHGVDDVSKDNEHFEYEISGPDLEYTFNICGPYLSLSNGSESINLTAYCFTDSAKSDLSLEGYSLYNSPLIDELDYFASSKSFNYAVRRDGSYYDLTAFKLSGDGRFTVYLEEKDILDGESEIFVGQYAYIVQSGVSSFLNSFKIVLLDEDKVYYYTDNISQREARVLEEDGVDVENIEPDKLKSIAEKKADLYDELYNEFNDKGINVTVNRVNGEIAMDASVLFGGDSSVVTDAGKELLNKFLSAYTTVIFNEKYDGFIEKTIVEGHTAPVGDTYEGGLPLSEERANNVKDYCLSSDSGIDVSKLEASLEAIGLSNSRPVYDADGNVDMAACRRVSFKFIVSVED